VTIPMHRKLIAEAIGTMVLVAAVIGSGIAAQRLSPSDVGLQLLENAVATGAALTALILALQPVSAAFNPIITLIEAVQGTLQRRHAAAAVTAQVGGGMVGAVLANLMFGESAVSIADTSREGLGIWLAEVVATAGLVIVIMGTIRSRRPGSTAFAVGAYIMAAYWFTSSTSFANPAVTVARTLSDSFAGISPSSVPWFVLAQAVGGAIGYLLSRTLYANPRLPDHRAQPEETTDVSSEQQASSGSAK
jgi:glycerol uptake facilitator-like aquaporin